jgi:hypothetical protein
VILSNNTEFFRKKKEKKTKFSQEKKVSFYDIILNFPTC